MKKIGLLVCSLFLLPLGVLAQSNPKVTKIETDVKNTTINYSGETENGSHAVVCKLYDSTDNEVNTLSSAVDKQKFDGSFTVTEAGNYTVACANYEGGEFKKVEVTVTKKENHEEEQPQEEVKEYVIIFETNGGSVIADQIYKEGDKTIEPANPTKENNSFGGWFTDAALKNAFAFGGYITENVQLYAKWDEIEEGKEETTKEFTIKDGDNSISFIEEKDRQFTFSMVDLATLTDADLEEMGTPREVLNGLISDIRKVTDQYGDFLAVYSILVVDKNDDQVELHEGPFQIRIKMTEEMKKYKRFKLIYGDTDDEGKVIANEEPIDLKIEGEYLVGTLKHLSGYVLVGQKEIKENPKTGDSVMYTMLLLAISSIGLCSTVYLKKKNSI